MACAAIGPCFQLRIENDVTVFRSGASLRTTTVVTTDTKRADLRELLPDKGNGEPSLVVLAPPSFVPSTPPAVRGGTPSASRAAWTRTREVEPGEAARDLTIHRRGRAQGAGNEATVRVDDYVLFQRVRYVETIGDSADTRSANATAETLALELSRITQRTAETLLARDFDVEPLQRYLSTTGVKALRDLFVQSIDANADLPAVVEAAIAFFARESIDVPADLLRKAADGTLDLPAEGDALLTGLRRGLVKKTASLLRRRDATAEAPGAPVTPQELDPLLTPGDVARAFERSIEAVSGKPAAAWNEGLLRGADGLYGSFGGALFDPDLGADSVHWTTRVRMPGMLLRTTGVPLRSGEVLWVFLSSDLALRQTACTAESIVLDERAIAALGGSAADAGPAEILELLTELGAGRERRPIRSKCQTLTRALEGDPAARELVRKHGDFEAARRILGLQP